MEWKLVAREGARRGQSFAIEDGSVMFGREPGPAGVALEGDPAVSRRHFEVEAAAGGLVLHNHSPNGTDVNGEIVVESCPLSAGDVIRAGAANALEVVREAGEARPAPRAAAKPAAAAPAAAPARRPPPKAASAEKPGLLQRPAVLIGLGAYALAMVAAFVFLTGGDEAEGTSWAATRAAYLERYSPEGISAEEKERRLARAEELLRELGAHQRSGRSDLARAACVDLMRLDADPASPLYKIGALRYARLPRAPR